MNIKKLNFSVKTKIISVLLLITFASTNVFAATRVSRLRQEFITYSLGFIGVPYIYGAADANRDGGFDCSGFVSYAANHGANVNLPRTAQAIYDSVEKIKMSEREPGDLVFFKNDLSSDRITHVGIYLGVYHGPEAKFEGKRVFVSAVSDGPRTGVVISLMDEKFWREHYFATGRFLPRTADSSRIER